jgi:hypothetical protein
MHGFPCFEWLAVQMWIIWVNSVKQTKFNSYRKHFYNCTKMVHVGLHSVGTYHKKFGWKKGKNKNILCRVLENGTRQRHLLPSVREWHSAKTSFTECQARAIGKGFLKTLKPFFAEHLSAGTRQRGLCRVPDPGHLAKCIFKLKKIFAECPRSSTRQRTFT